MARYSGGPRDLIDETAEALRAQCLINDGSVLFPQDAVWSPENFEVLYEKFVQNPLDDDRKFDAKFREQLADATPGARRLAAELLLTYVLFVKALLRPKTKRELVELPLRINDEALPRDRVAVRALEQGIGNPGSGLSMYRPQELTFLIELGRRFKKLELEQRRDLLDEDSPWAFGDWIDAEVPRAESRQMRHLLLHLLYPEHYERVGSGDHKDKIAGTFGELVDEEPETQDRLIYAIRKQLEVLLADKVDNVSKLDFYEPPIKQAWQGGGSAELDAVEFKRQIVLYGPPGTGKTHEAKQLAAQLVRRAALRDWGPVKFFENQDAVEDAARDNVHRLQLHPAYSYEEFIRGLHLDANARTVYRPGYLSRLVHTMSLDTRGLTHGLPHVVILDEMNRADLSRVFGEAFSLLENRDEVIELPMSGVEQNPLPSVEVEADQPPVDRLHLPVNLYFVGTMNLIDQSVEQIDFALRRRFLWKPMGFDKNALAEVLRVVWEDRVLRVDWEKVEGDMLALTAAAERLNDAIRSTAMLGPQYEIGHTYFFDIVDLTRRSFGKSGGARQTYYLWGGDGKPRAPLLSLWGLSLRPLLEQYLAGVEATEQQRLMASYEQAFTRPPSA